MIISKYTLAEQVGRDKALLILGGKTKIVEVEEPSAPYDLSGSTLSNNFFIEVKYRKCKSNTYDSDLLEYLKHKRMQNAVGEDDLRYYFVIYADGVARLYQLNNLNLDKVRITNFDCPNSSVEDKGTKEKLCVELPFAVAKKTYKINGKV